MAIKVGCFALINPFNVLENQLDQIKKWGFSCGDLTDNSDGACLGVEYGFTALASLDSDPFDIKRMFEERQLELSSICAHANLLGTTFYGSKGWISLSRSSIESDIPEIKSKLKEIPRDKNGDIIDPDQSMGQALINTIKGKSKELCPLEDAIISDTISHMGDIAIRTGRKVIWDPAKGECVNDPEASKLFVRELRRPYQV